MTDITLEPAVSRPANFRFSEVSSMMKPRTATSAAPSLGPLADFTGTFVGNGFNTIFRPQNKATPTPLPTPVPGPVGDNVLELNLTSETLSFSKSLGSVPNRGMVQGDIFLNGVPYLQTITDVTIPSQPTGIHFEPGMWVIVPSTTDPAEGPTLVRMASIPHGTTISAQGTFKSFTGKPTIPAIDITPFVTLSSPKKPVTFPSQTATNEATSRIPQDLTSFAAAGTITQAMLTDPATLLRNHIATQNIVSFFVLSISTNPASPLFGGGTDNIAFLLGDTAALTNPAPAGPNAQALQMDAVFWIETVEHDVHVPVFKPGQPPLTLLGETGAAGQPVPKFLANPPMEITTPRTIKVRSTQIQYSQLVFLNFNGLTWPHASVATLVPSEAIPIPPTAW
jgi:hypothetical protein